MIHSFHIPVLGLGYSIDSPLKVARYGITSVVSIVDDILIEEMRKFHCAQQNLPFEPFLPHIEDSRAKRITAYLNLMQDLVNQQFDQIQNQEFISPNDILKYFELLPDSSSYKQLYNQMLSTSNRGVKAYLQQKLRSLMKPGAIDVNIMAKVDKTNVDATGKALDDVYSDALAAFRGYAQSNLESSIILSAGMNPRLYSYIERFEDFFPSENGTIKKQIVLKVSDFRSALIQGKFLAKKGIWVSEFRIESGLNCGGHAFATDGYLLGPILEEFKTKKSDMISELYALYQRALIERDKTIPTSIPTMRISAQGGIGTTAEQNFLLNYYNLDITGWGSPFLLVPEATNVDEDTLKRLTTATADDFYISNASPLNVPFNHFRDSTVEEQRLERIAKGRPGNPCKKKFLVSNTEFGVTPLCTASREYQHLKIKQLGTENLSETEYKLAFDTITEKICLCDSLCSSVYIKNNTIKPRQNKAVAICPGPNIVHFSKTYSLEEMVQHIYGKVHLFDTEKRSHLFINELQLYVDYFKKDLNNHLTTLNDRKKKHLNNFKAQLLNGIEYYKQLIPNITLETDHFKQKMQDELLALEYKLIALSISL
ncbi:hypothetical protein [Flavobacterium sp. '19STA2R22 D10 B1']|uniref:hypothetical protein n=1 Tax=Flavobacterium aerium TaxID=3037261 RepID=UPI00278C44B7|nr:hypothetical protein [Flavobacterium sp. '19STA2R22 D10 B1']